MQRDNKCCKCGDKATIKVETVPPREDAYFCRKHAVELAKWAWEHSTPAERERVLTSKG